MKSIVPEALEDFDYESIEEALNTSCPVCGVKLDWSIKYVYVDKYETHFLYAESESCGLEFFIQPVDMKRPTMPGYEIIIKKKEHST